MMESGSPGNEAAAKPLIHPGGMWSSSDPALRTSVTEAQDATNNSQFLFIAVEYVNDANVDYSNINSTPTFTSNQEFSELSDHLNPLDSTLNSQNEYSYINNESHLNNSTTFNQNSIVILPNNTESQSGYSLNSVESNMDLLRQVVTNRLCRQIENSIDLKQENDSVELLITNQNNGLPYSLNSDTSNLPKQTDIMLNNLDSNNADRILDSQSLVLDSNHLISLDEHVLMDNGTLVLKSDLNPELNSVVQHIDLNHLETNISQTIDDNYKAIEDAYMKEHIQSNDVVMEDNTEKNTNFVQSMEMKIEENDFVKNEDVNTEEVSQVRRSKRHLFEGKEFEDDDDSDLFTDCPDCIVGSSVVVMCDRHRMLSISDKPVPTRARATLPAVVSINKVGTDDKGQPIFGVFTRKLIPKRTQFGPIEGVIVKDSPADVKCYNNIELVLESDSGEMHKMDTSNEDLSNWMRFVRKADTFKEQNLVLNQMGPSLFYISTCNILPRQELLVGYSAVYAEKRGLTVLPNELNEEEWPCFECNSMCVSFEELEKHLNNVHGVDNALQSAERRLSRMKRSKKKRSELGIKKVSKEMPWTWKDNSSKSVDSDVNGIVSSTEKDPLSEKENEEKVFYTCKECKKVFELSILLEIHNYIHNSNGVVDTSVTSSSDEQHICPECDVIFSSRYTLAFHVNDHQIKVRSTKIKCNKCYKSFASKERVQRHMLVHGPQKLKPLQCNMCSKRFLNNSALTCHVKAHSKVTFECPICKEVVDHVLSHKEHVRSHCINGIYTCPHCKKEFKEYSVIRKHIRAFHCDRKHECLYCNKLFPTTDKLRMHLLKHSDHREFLCAACGKQFKRKDKLKEHTKRMHSGKEKNEISQVMVLMDNKQDEQNNTSKRFMPKVSPTDYHRFIYKCHTCMVGFKRRGMLVNHLAKRHPDIRPDSVPELNLPILRTTRDYYCQYCDKVYKSSSKRKAHILKNHPGLELPLSNRCKDTADISGMMNPTFSQTVGSVTTNPHNCLWCHKQYASKAKLLQHQRNKHPHLISNDPKDTIPPVPKLIDPLLIDNLGSIIVGTHNMKPQKTADILENNKPVETDNKNSTNMQSEFLNTDGFDSGILLNSKGNNIKVDEQFSREMLTETVNNIQGEFRISQNGQCYRIVPVSSDQDSVIPVGDSVLRALLTTTTPVVNRTWSETTPFTSYIPPR